jgi:hypothetical protein
MTMSITASGLRFSFLVILSTLISQCSTTENIGRNLASLEEKWNISDTNFSYADLQFNLNHTISDFVLDDMISYEVYDRDCQDGNVLVPESALGSSIQTDSTPPGEGDGIRNTKILLSVNTNNIANEPTVYSEETVDGMLIAKVDFCVRFSLWTPSMPTIEVNFLETLVTLLVNLTDGFSIDDVTVKPKEKLLNTANNEYSLEGFQCDQQNAPLSEEELLEARNQGSIIRICVRPDETARDDSVYMKSIVSFRFTREFENPTQNPPVVQIAVEDEQEAGNHLTSLYCEAGMLVCAFESILFAAFYRDPGMIQGSGTALMQFGTSGGARRRLRSPRDLQKKPTEEVLSQFDIDVELVPLEDGFRSSDAHTKLLYAWLVTFLSLMIIYTIH